MLINNKDIQDFGGKLIYRNLSSNRVSQGATWDYFLDRPVDFGAGIEFKDVKLKVLVVAKSEDIFQRNLNKLSEEFRRGGVVKFKDLPYTYKMYLKQKPEYEKLNETNYEVEFNLDSDFGISEKIFKSGSNSITLTNKGTYATPVKMVINVPAMQSTFSVSGFAHTFTMKSIPQNATITIDSSTGEVSINGSRAIDKVTSFHLPKLTVGETTIKGSANCTINLEYYERY